MRRRAFSLILLSLPVLLSAMTLACSGSPAAPRRAKPAIDPAALTSFAPLPDTVPAVSGTPSAEMVTLGRMLFYEPRLSKSQKISCNSCHDLFEVRRRRRADIRRAQGPEGRPQLAHGLQRRGALQAVLGRPGRRRGGTGQGPVLNPVEMAMRPNPWW